MKLLLFRLAALLALAGLGQSLAAQVKISALPAASALGTTDTVPIVQGGTTKAATIAQLTPVIQQNALSTRLRRVGFAGDSQGWVLGGFFVNSVWYWAQAYKPRAFLYDAARWNFGYPGTASGPERLASSSTVSGHAAVDGQDFDTPKTLAAIVAANLDDLWIATCGNDASAPSDPALCYRNVKEAIDYLRANSTIKRFIIYSAVLPKDAPQNNVPYQHALFRQLAATTNDVFFFEAAQYLVDDGSGFNPVALNGGAGSGLNDAVGHISPNGARLLAANFNTFLDSIGGYPVIQPRAVYQQDVYSSSQGTLTGPGGNVIGEQTRNLTTASQSGTQMTVTASSTGVNGSQIMIGSLITGTNVPTGTRVLYDSTNSTTQCGGGACTGSGSNGTYGVSTSATATYGSAVSHAAIGAFSATERNAAYIGANATAPTTANVTLSTNNAAITVTGSRTTITVNGATHNALHLAFTAASNLSACGAFPAVCKVTVAFPNISVSTGYSASRPHVGQFVYQLNSVTNLAALNSIVKCNDGTNTTTYSSGAAYSVAGQASIISGPISETLTYVLPGFMDFTTAMTTGSTTTPYGLFQATTGTCTGVLQPSVVISFASNVTSGTALGSMDIAQTGIWPLPALPY